MDKTAQLEQRMVELEKKVSDLYSASSFPNAIIENLKNIGFVKIDSSLLQEFYTQDERYAKSYSMFAKVGNKNVVFTPVDRQEYTQIQSINTSTDVFTSNNHGLGDGDIFSFWSTGDAPDPLMNGGTYYVVDSTTNTFKLESSIGGGAINITDTGSGVHYLIRINIIF